MKIDRNWLYPFVALMSFVTGLCAANARIQWLPHSGDAATWVGAIGAMLAFLGTILVATDQTRQKNLESHNKAVLTVARLLPRIHKFAQVIADIEQTTRDYESERRDIEYGRNKSLIQMACTWTPDEILPLIVLPNNVAYRLEFIAATAPLISQKFSNDMQRAEIYGHPYNNRIDWHYDQVRSAVDEYCASLREIESSIKVVVAECEAIIPQIR